KEERQPEQEIPEDVKSMAELRLEARKQKNWAESDRLRDVIAYMGYDIKDTKDGYELSVRVK
ncbi:MAG: cysteine--tRNA ligase, partial [Firmicutes bacterium]|nr:cysteine--tRNA ligase [Bacillota bacterium]